MQISINIVELASFEPFEKYIWPEKDIFDSVSEIFNSQLILTCFASLLNELESGVQIILVLSVSLSEILTVLS